MDAYEATKVVLSRIQGLDPENASKIMGYILIQDQGEKEMIRLAFGPETHLVSLMSEAKACLGLESNSLSATPRITIPNNNGVFTRSPRPPSSLSYAAVVNGSTTGLSFVDESIMSPSGRSDSLVYPFEETPPHHHLHRRSYSVNDAFVDDGDNSNGWRPCMYYARGFCKNGNTCKFVHTGDSSDAAIVASSTKLDSFDDFLRIKALQQQRFAAASLMARQHHHHPLAYNNILNDNERSAAAAFMMGEDIHKIGRCHPDRNDFSVMAMSASSSRQIYLTFPADSTFKEEDVSNYFSMYGPVQDVRIPYQQKRMFGFVTFVHPETVKLILAKGNPHFVCDSRVLVKPYKEKGKVMDKRQQHPIDRELMSCLSPSALESREPYDLPFGGRMLYNSHKMMLRRKLEQEAELQQAIELQGRRLMNLQLMDLKNQHRNHHFPVSQSPGMPIHTHNSHILGSFSNGIDQEIPAENYDTHEAPKSPSDVDDEKVPSDVGNEGGNKEQTTDTDDSYLHDSLEHILPDNLFASPTKSAAEHQATFSTEAGVSSPMTSNNISMLPKTSTLNMASVNSCYLHMPRFTSGQEAIEM